MTNQTRKYLNIKHTFICCVQTLYMWRNEDTRKDECSTEAYELASQPLAQISGCKISTWVTNNIAIINFLICYNKK